MIDDGALAEGILSKLIQPPGGLLDLVGGRLEDVDQNSVELTPAEADYLRRRWAL